MNSSRIVLVLVLVLFLVSSGVSADESDSIRVWIEDNEPDDINSWNVSSIHTLFNNDFEEDTRYVDQATNGQNKTEIFKGVVDADDEATALSRIDFVFDSYPYDVDRWNSYTHSQFNAYDSGRDQYTYIPRDGVDLADDSSQFRFIKDAYVDIHSISPLVYVHRPIATSSESDVVSPRVGDEVTVRAITDFRLNDDLDWENPRAGERAFFYFEDRTIESAELTVGDCESASCTYTTRPSERLRFSDVEIPEGSTKLSVSTTVSATFERVYEEQETRTREVTKTRVVDGSTETYTATETYTVWVEKEREDITEEFTVSTDRTVNRQIPTAEATKVVYPSGTTQYKITGLQSGTWSQIRVESDDSSSRIESQWIYMSGRDAAWDTPELRGSQETFESDVQTRPLIVHSFPRPTTEFVLSTNGVTVDTLPSVLSYPAPSLQSETCPDKPTGFSITQSISSLFGSSNSVNTCPWLFPGSFDDDFDIRSVNTYEAPESVIFTHQTANETVNASLYIDGVNPTVSNNIEITDTERIHPVNLTVTVQPYTDDPSSATYPNDIPTQGYTRLRINAVDDFTGDPIDTTDRASVIEVESTVHEDVQTIEQNLVDGSTTIDVPVSDTNQYVVRFVAPSWHTTPDDVRPKYAGTQEIVNDVSPDYEFWYGLVEPAIIILAIAYIVRRSFRTVWGSYRR